MLALCFHSVQAALALEGVKNFRAVSPSLPGMYRSAGLEQATAADAAYILDAAKVRTIIDLRNDDEIETAERSATDFGRQLVAAYDSGAMVGPGCVASEGSGRLRRVHVPLLCNVDAFFDGVAAQLSPQKKAEAMAYKTFDAKRYDKLLYDEVARGKQTLLYTTMLQTSSGWGDALRIAANRDRGGVLFHCAQGKDRTGVLAMLLQHAAGDSEADIVKAYAVSEGLLAQYTDQGQGYTGRPQVRDAEERRRQRQQASAPSEEAQGVDWSALRGSPPEAMVQTLTWLRQEHGAIDNFLHRSGCDEPWRQQLLRGPPASL